jgi:hypothetical protein
LKQTAAIFLLLLLSFHWYGYRVIVSYWQGIADQKMEKRLDIRDYNESELVEIRVPLNMPYQTGFTAFERCYGEIEIDGIVHAYVKRRIENGDLILKCIPDHEKQAIKNASNTFFGDNYGLSIDHNQKHSSPVTKVFKSTSCDCENHSLYFALDYPSGLPAKIFISHRAIIPAYLAVREQPPEPVS